MKKCCERDTDNDGECPWHPCSIPFGKPTFLPPDHEAVRERALAALDQSNPLAARIARMEAYPGFTVICERDPFEHIMFFIVRCGGARATFEISRNEAVEMEDAVIDFIMGRIVELMERMWSCWMAL